MKVRVAVSPIWSAATLDLMEMEGGMESLTRILAVSLAVEKCSDFMPIICKPLLSSAT